MQSWNKLAINILLSIHSQHVVKWIPEQKKKFSCYFFCDFCWSLKQTFLCLCPSTGCSQHSQKQNSSTKTRRDSGQGHFSLNQRVLAHYATPLHWKQNAARCLIKGTTSLCALFPSNLPLRCPVCHSHKLQLQAYFSSVPHFCWWKRPHNCNFISLKSTQCCSITFSVFTLQCWVPREAS